MQKKCVDQSGDFTYDYQGALQANLPQMPYKKQKPGQIGRE